MIRSEAGSAVTRSADAPGILTGGIVAHNDEHRIERSIRSLLDQRLPGGTEWGRIWVVASGCTDGTVTRARSLAEEEDRLEVLVEPRRRGKSAALGEVLRRAEGESLVLLNSDAIAEPGSVAALLETARDKSRPFAVMARPVVDGAPATAWPAPLRWMWELHHSLHSEMLADGRGAHLSDEMMLVSLPAYPWIEDGIINDGSYCAVWLQQHGGRCWYAPGARVAVEVPSTPADHLRQRRRIHAGNVQVNRLLGRPPTTVLRYLFQEPRRTLRAFRSTMRDSHWPSHVARVALLELAGHGLALWDRLPPRRNHVLWERIRPSAVEPAGTAGGGLDSVADEVDRRIETILSLARQFDAPVSSEQLAQLLPRDGPSTTEELERYLARRPEWARTGVVPAGSDPSRTERGERYLRFAETLVDGPLAPLRDWVACVGITGSAAYGAPKEGDDLDFFVVTRSGATSGFLALTYAALRLHAWRTGAPVVPEPCFNYVIDDRRAPQELGVGAGLLFAREALTARMIRGDDYYRGLLRSAPRLATELPRLYDLRTRDAGPTAERPAPATARIASALAFLPLAAYLQLVGIYRNGHLPASGSHDAEFRTVTTPRRFAFQSRRFERLRSEYAGPTSAERGGPPARMSTAR